MTHATFRRSLLLMPLLFALLPALAGAAPGKPPALLALSSGAGESYGENEVRYVNPRAARELTELGFQRSWHVGWNDLTLAYLKQFNAVLLYDVAASSPSGPSPEVQKTLDLLRTYVEQGGSVWIANAAYWSKKVPTMNAFLAGMNAQVFTELVRDEATAGAISTGLHFSWTDAITPSPLTAGVSGLLYGTDFWEPNSPNTTPIQVGPEWQVLVKGLPTAASFQVSAAVSETVGPGTFAASPPLVAVRDWGQGRVVLWPMSLSYTLMDGYSRALLEGVVMDGAIGEHHSQGAKLCYNLLQWMVQPSVAKPDYGGFTGAPEVAPPPTTDVGLQPAPPLSVPPLHSRNPLPALKPQYAHAYRGLWGAQSNLSVGTESPAQLIAAARAAGYDFVIFAEDLAKLTPEGWQTLETACKAGTNDTFAAFPGYYYKTVYGAEFVTFGGPGDLQYPQPEWLTPVAGERRLRENNCVVRGMAIVPPVVMVYPHRNPRTIRVNSEVYGFATHTYEGAKLVNEAVQPYLETQREGLCLFPAVVHFTRTATEIATLPAAGPQMCVRANTLALIPRSLQGFDSAQYNDPGWAKPGYVSAGPEIQWLTVENWGTVDLAYENSDWHRVDFLVASAVGLQEVRVYDGPRLWRRFLPGGAPRFEQHIINYHDAAHVYLLEAIDTQGHHAWSWSRMTDAQECWHEMCGDNWNDMAGGKWTLVNGGAKLDRVALAGTEFAPTLNRAAALWQWPLLANDPAGPAWWACLKQTRVVSRWGWDLDYSLNQRYDGPGWAGLVYDNRAVLPNAQFSGSLRATMVVGRTPQPNFTLLEGTVTWKTDYVFKGTPGLQAAKVEGMMDNYALPGPDGRAVVQKTPASVPYQQGDLRPNEYLATWPVSGGLLNLGDAPLAYAVSSTGLAVGLGKQGETAPTGSPGTWRVLAVAGSPDNTLWERIRTQMGLVGPPAYSVTPLVGSVESTRLFLKLKADNGAFRGVITQADLPLVLPVQIGPLNPNWSAGIWYRGENVLLTPEWRDGLSRVGSIPRLYRDKLFRAAVVGDTAWLTVDLAEKNRDVFLGTFLVADAPALALTLVQDPDRDYVVVHNSTDKPITATVRAAAGFDRYGPFSAKVAVPAGSSLNVDLPARP